jgi:DNA-binding NarL/FixJ family response regulator
MIDRMVSSVLVVDDDPSFLALAVRVLEEMGVERVVTAPDAATALFEADNRRPEAALVDVGLPDREGIDLARQLAELPWKPQVVLTSTDQDAGLAIGNSQDGALAFVPKEDLAGRTLRRLLLGD